MVGWIAYGVLVVPVTFLIVTHRAFGQSPLSLGLQIAGLALVVWARVAFGARSFHAGSTPTEGGLVTSGPYHFIRHPIYAGVLLALAGALVAHHDAPAVAAAVIACAAIGVRIASEERQVAARYPEYVDYARRTRRVLPWLL